MRRVDFRGEGIACVVGVGGVARVRLLSAWHNGLQTRTPISRVALGSEVLHDDTHQSVVLCLVTAAQQLTAAANHYHRPPRAVAHPALHNHLHHFVAHHLHLLAATLAPAPTPTLAAALAADPAAALPARAQLHLLNRHADAVE